MEVQGQSLLHKDFEASPGYIRPRVKNQTKPNQNKKPLAPREAEPLWQPGEPSASLCTEVQSERPTESPLAVVLLNTTATGSLAPLTHFHNLTMGEVTFLRLLIQLDYTELASLCKPVSEHLPIHRPLSLAIKPACRQGCSSEIITAGRDVTDRGWLPLLQSTRNRASLDLEPSRTFEWVSMGMPRYCRC